MKSLNWKNRSEDDGTVELSVNIGGVFELVIEGLGGDNDEYSLVMYSIKKSENGKHEELDLLQGKKVSLSSAKHLGYLFVKDMAALIDPTCN